MGTTKQARTHPQTDGSDLERVAEWETEGPDGTGRDRQRRIDQQTNAPLTPSCTNTAHDRRVSSSRRVQIRTFVYPGIPKWYVAIRGAIHTCMQIRISITGRTI